MFGVIDKVNNCIIKKIKLYLEVAEKGEESEQRITYILQVIINEVEKFVLLLTVFTILGYATEYMVIMMTIGAIRGYLGGGHRKTTEGCIIFSFAIVLIILIFARCSYLPLMLMEFIYITIVVMLIKKAPVLTNKSINYSQKKRQEFKLKGMVVLLIISRVIEAVPKEWANIMLSALMIQVVEVGIECILNRKRGEKDGEEA